MEEWVYKGKKISTIDDVPVGTLGFVYVIINEKNGKKYIGKKILGSVRRLPPLKGQKRVRRVWKESNWQKYTGSNKLLNEEIKAKGVEIKREILRWCATKREMTYYEAKLQFQNEVLENEQYYNDNILGKFFRKDT